MSRSSPGSTTAPLGSRATACMNSAVVPREPVEPATITGSRGGDSGQRRANSSAMRRCRAAGSGAASGSSVRNCPTRSRNRRLRAQCPDWSATSSPAMASMPTPSPCISSISAARPVARSKAAVSGARSGCAAIRPATSRVSSSRRRSAGTDAAASGGPRCDRSVTSRIRGRSRAGPWSNSSATRRAIRVVVR